MSEDNIRVVSQSTSERLSEAEENFFKIKPYLDEGYDYVKACMLAGLCGNRYINHYRWFREIIEVGEEYGYFYRGVVKKKEFKW